MTDTKFRQLPPRSSVDGPRLTVVMPTYRRSHQIGETIRSLLAQTWTDFELLVRDDGNGLDGTEEAVLVTSGGDARVRYHRNQRKLGMPQNLNAGVMESRGSLIAVCHDHDIYKPSFLADMVETISRYPTALFVHCAIDLITQSGAYVRSHVGAWPELSNGHIWLKFMLKSLHCPVCALTVVRREAHEQYGLYDPSFGFIADIEMWMRLALHGDVAYVRHPQIQVREREESHVTKRNGVLLACTVASIHRRYIPYAYGLPERLFRRMLLELKLVVSSIRDRAAKVKRQGFRSTSA